MEEKDEVKNEISAILGTLNCLFDFRDKAHRELQTQVISLIDELEKSWTIQRLNRKDLIKKADSGNNTHSKLRDAAYDISMWQQVWFLLILQGHLLYFFFIFYLNFNILNASSINNL